MKLALPGILILTTVLALSCTPRSAPDEPLVESGPEPTVAPGPLAPASAQPPTVPTTAPVIRVFDESLLRGHEFLLEMPTPNPIGVRDPDLGLLGFDPEVEKTLNTFFGTAARGSLDEETLVPRWADYLQAWARRFQQQGWHDLSVRVGVAVTSEGNELVFPIRVSGKERAASGWAALVREGKHYLVSDVQLAEAVLRTTPFDPESPPQEISSPSRR